MLSMLGLSESEEQKALRLEKERVELAALEPDVCFGELKDLFDGSDSNDWFK
jgi:hypothetical protein